MKPISQYFAACRTLSAAEFADRHPGPFLVHSSLTGGALRPTSGGRTLDELVVDEPGSGEAESLTVFSVSRFVPRPDEITIGSEKSSSLCVAAASVSRVHARLMRVGGAWHVEDAGSSAGTWVNGEEVTRPRALHAGDRLSLGTLDLTFLPSAAFHELALRTSLRATASGHRG
jgi:pSer/pThr/pTyr-binding forkhead associated (FHA) protein